MINTREKSSPALWCNNYFILPLYIYIFIYICIYFVLLKVGRETINSSDDTILKQDMPAALHRVEDASKLLEEASAMLKLDPFSGPAR